LDFDRLKQDISRFANSVLKKASSRYKKSRAQTSQAAKLRKLLSQQKQS
jgi:hypothetical protein